MCSIQPGDFGPVFEAGGSADRTQRQQRMVQEDSVMSAISSVHDVFSRSSSSYGEMEYPAGGAGSPSRGTEGRSQQPLRLTRRGWLVLVVLPLAMVAASLMILTGAFTAPAQASDSASQLSLTPTVSVTVQPGESLWGIASALAPERDPRDVVADIVQLNNLTGGAVTPGQQLFVPHN